MFLPIFYAVFLSKCEAYEYKAKIRAEIFFSEVYYWISLPILRKHAKRSEATETMLKTTNPGRILNNVKN